ncbi:MAG: MerR family transcriptional regulator [Streptosporangiaceae bacterium]
MRISQLSQRTGVPTATIKYYLREGLLPPGRPTAATQAQYDETHVRRLRLIRALAEAGHLSLAAIQRILRAVDDEATDAHRTLGTAHHALGPHVEVPADDREWLAARADVDAFLDDLGWRVSAHAPARDGLAQAVLALRRLGVDSSWEDLRRYADAARPLAEHELARVARAEGREEMIRVAVASSVLYEPVLLALRRLAQEHESALRFRENSTT